MKKWTFTLLLCSLFGLGALQAQHDVTFTVDMSNYGGTFTQVYVSGSFNGWSGTSNPLTDMGNGLWGATFPLPEGPHEYKFTVDDWADQEMLTPGEPCTITDPSGQFTNRLVDVTGPTTLPEVCWNSCLSCNPMAGDISLAVDMSEYTGSFTTVYVAGGFNGWCGNCNPLEDPDGDMVWTGTVTMQPGLNEYKFEVDDWADQEMLTPGDPCTITDPTGQFTNRKLLVDGNAEVDTVCWASCDPCGVVPPMDGNITFAVDMSEYAGSFTTVFVAGSFNGWCGDCNPLEDPDGDMVWTGTYPLPAGPNEYKFEVDNWADQEMLTPGDPCTITDPSGQFTNRLIEVDGDSTLAEVCWGSCVDCGVQTDGNITFAVDMSEYTGSFTTVFVAGSFNGWCGNCNPLEDPDGDMVWTGTYLLPAGPNEYKFEVDDWADQEILTEGDPCTITTGGFTNRFIEVNGDATLPEVCWGSCEVCNPPTLVSITFNLNMEFHPPDPSGVFIAGGAAFGVPGDNPLEDPDGDGVYSITFMKEVGFSSHYTFTNGLCPDFSCKENIGGQPCADPNNFNDRFLPPVMQDTIINTCFGECTDDLMCTPPGEPLDVTFRVNMQEEMTNPDGVFMGASFDNWSGNIALEDPDGDDIWEVTIELQPGLHEYKFINGPGWCCAEVLDSLDAACTINPPFYNRFVNVMGSEPIELDPVCFGTCDLCPTSTVEVVPAEQLFRLMPSLVRSTDARVLFQGPATAHQVEVRDVLGRLIHYREADAGTPAVELPSRQWGGGLYFVTVRSEARMGTAKLVVTER